MNYDTPNYDKLVSDLRAIVDRLYHEATEATPDKGHEGSGYWTNYARIVAAFQSGSLVGFSYLKPNDVLGYRECIILGPIQTSADGSHYVKAVDLNQDAPRTFRIDRMRGVSGV